MMLLEQGKLQLDDPVSKYLSGFDNLKVITKFNEADGTYETRPAKRAMTIRHLLTHTSGIGYAFCNPIVARLQKGNQKSEWEIPLLSDPGDKWNYSASTRVLGLIVEKITGATLEAWDQEHIFKPLGMVDTSYAVASGKQSRLTMTLQPHRRRHQGAAARHHPVHTDGTVPGRWRSVFDGSRLRHVHAHAPERRPPGCGQNSQRAIGAHLMGENNIGSIFVEQQPDADPLRTRPFPLGAGKDKFGLGFQIASKNDAFAKFRSPGSMSWAGIFNTEFWVDPVRHIGGVQMMQILPFYDDGAIRTLRDFEALVYQGLK